MGERVLILKLSSLGDIVHALPVAAGLRAACPRAELAWAVGQRWLPLVEHHPALDRVIPLHGARWSAVREYRPDVALDLQGNLKSALLGFYSGARRRIGLDSPWLREHAAAWFYTRRVRPQAIHITGQLLELAGELGAIPPQPAFSLPIPETITKQTHAWRVQNCPRPAAFLLPGGGWESKLWPAERYRELASWLEHELELTPVVNHGPHDRLFEQAGIRIFQGGLLPLATMLQQARLAVGGDTGPLHLAAALGTPSIGLFGPTDPARNGPRGEFVRILYKGRKRNSRHGRYARGRITSPELLAISTEEVAATCAELLATAPQIA